MTTRQHETVSRPNKRQGGRPHGHTRPKSEPENGGRTLYACKRRRNWPKLSKTKRTSLHKSWPSDAPRPKLGKRRNSWPRSKSRRPSRLRFKKLLASLPRNKDKKKKRRSKSGYSKRQPVKLQRQRIGSCGWKN